MEEIILKNIILDKSFFNKTKAILNPDIFTNSISGKLYNIITDFYEKYHEVPSLQELVIAIKNTPNAEVRKQLGETLIKIKETENIKQEFLNDETVKYVKNQLFTQALMLGAEFIEKRDEKYKVKARELIEQSQKININDDLGDEYDDIEERIDYYQNPQKGLKFQTMQTLNDFIGEGFLKGSLNLVMAGPGTGKSLFLSTAISDFLLQRKNILLVSMEMANFEFIKRIDANLLDIQINTFKEINPDIIREKFKKLEVGKLFAQNYPAGSFSANNLSGLLEMYKSNEIYFDAVFLDYLGIMKSDRVSPSAGLYSYIKAIGEEVRAIAKIYDIPIFSCSQLNRSSVNNTDASNDAISDSLGTAMTADWICFLLQNEQMKSNNIIKFKITKNRYNGKTSSFDMNVNYGNMKFEDTGIKPLESEINVKELDELIREQNKDLIKNNLKENDVWNFK